MYHLKLSILIIGLMLLAGCGLINKSEIYRSRTTVFIEALMKGDYDKCTEQLALESSLAKGTNIDTIKMGLKKFRTELARDFGTKLEFSSMEIKKKRSTKKAESTPPNTTLVLMEFENEKYIGVLKLLFDDTSDKIINISAVDVKTPKPNMLPFWLFGLLPLTVLAFNIYVIRQIKRSTQTKKLRKYLAVAMLNFPSVSYGAVSGISIKVLYFQFLMGVGASFTGYFGSVFTFGLPIGGLYWLIALKRHKDREKLDNLIEESYNRQRIEAETHKEVNDSQ